MSDLKMKLITNDELRLKMKSSDSISMKFDDYQKFKEEDPIFKDSPAYKITNDDIYNWNHKSDFSGSYTDLTNRPNLNVYATKSELSEGLSGKVDKELGMGLSQNSFTTEEKNKLATLENYDDTAIVEALATKADISSVPTKVSELDNDSGFITKNVDDLTYYPTNDSVNSIVSLKQNIINSDNMLSADLVDDTSATNKFVTATDITTWNNKSDFSGNYNDLTNKPTIPTKTSELTNDSGFITNANIPTKTSDLTNDSGYITNAVNDLTNYTLSSNLATVATTGDYGDLINKPTIPTMETLNTFSATEKVVGTFEGKPLYRIIYEDTPNVAATTTSTGLNIPISGVKEVFITPYTKIADSNSSGYVYAFPFVTGTVTIGGYISVQTTKLLFNLRKTNNVAVYKIRYVLEYTKTSD